VAAQLTIDPNNFLSNEPSLVIYGHPNHELATFGLLQRLKPHMVFLTDGGSDQRLKQTRQGLSSIGLLDRATFLNHRENDFYGALLRHDTDFFAAIAEQVCEHIREIGSEQVLCDAVEFYNPIHDLALPIAQAAMKRVNRARLFELPLIFQRAGASESFVLQRPSMSRADESISFLLSAAEFQAKIQARNEVYTILTQQLGPQLSQVPADHWTVEWITNARANVPRPEPDVALRYDQRAELLFARAEVAEKILYHEHYLPVAAKLFS
jgi:hypothetical protein